MKTNYLFVIVSLLIAQSVCAQNDTIRGVVLDVKNKAVKKQAVATGGVSSLSTTTDSKGFFTFPDANLQDTLYLKDKKGKTLSTVPVNGYPFITIKLLKDDFSFDYLSEPDERFLNYLRQLDDAAQKDFGVLRQEDIKRSGCTDMLCLLRGIGGVSISNGGIVLAGVSSSIRGSTNALIVLDGSVTDLDTINSMPVEDIEDITVLKDGSKYGARGANGAVEIRTRRN